MKRAYICHTYYHVYVSILKEINYQRASSKDSLGDIILSKMSTNFKDLKKRIENTGIFNNVLEMDEKRVTYLIKDNIDLYSKLPVIFKIFSGFLFYKKIALGLEPFIDIDFSKYDKIFVFCDSDPIAYYLNNKKIKYIAVEDGLDSFKYDKIKNIRKFMVFKKILVYFNLKFLPHGYSKYAIAVEVNDINGVCTPIKKTYEQSRKKLLDMLNADEKKLIYRVFLEGKNVIYRNNTYKTDNKTALIVTQPFCNDKESIEKIQNVMYRKIITDYCKGYTVFIKPHPIDQCDYDLYFKDCLILEKYMPIEVLNFNNTIHFNRVITIFSTSIDSIEFADEKIKLGKEYIYKYGLT